MDTKLAALDRLVEESKRKEEKEVTELKNWHAGYRYGLLAAIQIMSTKEEKA